VLQQDAPSVFCNKTHHLCASVRHTICDASLLCDHLDNCNERRWNTFKPSFRYSWQVCSSVFVTDINLFHGNCSLITTLLTDATGCWQVWVFVSKFRLDFHVRLWTKVLLGYQHMFTQGILYDRFVTKISIWMCLCQRNLIIGVCKYTVLSLCSAPIMADTGCDIFGCTHCERICHLNSVSIQKIHKIINSLCYKNVLL
jgi:hypothetical protein